MLNTVILLLLAPPLRTYTLHPLLLGTTRAACSALTAISNRDVILVTGDGKVIEYRGRRENELGRINVNEVQVLKNRLLITSNENRIQIRALSGRIIRTVGRGFLLPKRSSEYSIVELGGRVALITAKYNRLSKVRRTGFDTSVGSVLDVDIKRSSAILYNDNNGKLRSSIHNISLDTRLSNVEDAVFDKKDLIFSKGSSIWRSYARGSNVVEIINIPDARFLQYREAENLLIGCAQDQAFAIRLGASKVFLTPHFGTDVREVDFLGDDLFVGTLGGEIYRCFVNNREK